MVTQNYLYPISALLIGVVFGSFNNVLIYRLPRKIHIKGRSKCIKCQKQISWLENIPILSFLFLKGKCKHCGTYISRKYPLIELVTGLLCAIISVPDAGLFVRISILIFVIIGVSIFFIDLEFNKIPNSLNLALIVLLTFSLVLDSVTNQDYQNLKRGILSSILCFIFFLLISIISKGGMGMGDVKFAPAIGLLTGYFGYSTVYFAFMIAFLLGSITGIFLIITKSKGKKSSIPFGPFMFIGCYFVLLATIS